MWHSGQKRQSILGRRDLRRGALLLSLYDAGLIPIELVPSKLINIYSMNMSKTERPINVGNRKKSRPLSLFQQA
jgi:hypothetical protein